MQNNIQPGSQPLREMRGKSHRADPAAKAFSRQQANRESGHEYNQAGRMDGVELTGEDKPFQAQQGGDGEESLDSRWPGNIFAFSHAPQVEKVKLVTYVKGEETKRSLDRSPDDGDVIQKGIIHCHDVSS